MPTLARSLSGRLLVLTILFVMLAEVLIFTPSIARFRVVWLEEKLAAGHLAALTVLAAPENMVTAELEAELLDHVGAYRLYLARPGEPMLALGGAEHEPVTHIVDLDDRSIVGLIADAFSTMTQGSNRVIRVIGMSPREETARVEVILDEGPLCESMIDFSWRILALSIIISLITAGLVFLSLRWLTVRPLIRFTEKMVAFREDPEDGDNIIQPSRRTDEVGVAERELRDMQVELVAALKQQSRLAALGTAVSKINHDLRNILATAILVSERLTASENPEVQKTATTVVHSLDRAVDLCGKTLTYTSEGGPPLRRDTVDIHDLVEEAGSDLAPVRSERTAWINRVAEGLTAHADPDQLLRVLDNLGKNAYEAGAETVTVTATRRASFVDIELVDDGPGLPPRAREHLFKPFAGTARRGGTGLGLAIAREIMVAHRGDIRLIHSDASGTRFRLELPG